ncbi:hypothetical protein B0H12DRAFT_1118351 [Mycena haematopus]|nr:hypothetical protein B0H12DRAFT_1118351 [Mycena haematopus]
MLQKTTTLCFYQSSSNTPRHGWKSSADLLPVCLHGDGRYYWGGASPCTRSPTHPRRRRGRRCRRFHAYSSDRHRRLRFRRRCCYCSRERFFTWWAAGVVGIVRAVSARSWWTRRSSRSRGFCGRRHRGERASGFAGRR